MKKKFFEPTVRGFYPISILTGALVALAISCVALEYLGSMMGEMSRMAAEAMSFEEAEVFWTKMHEMGNASVYIPFSELLYMLQIPARIFAIPLVLAAATLFGTTILGTGKKERRSKYIQATGIAAITLAIGLGIDIMIGIGDAWTFLLLTVVVAALTAIGLLAVRITLK